MRTRSPGKPPVTNVTRPSMRPTPCPFSRRSSRTMGSRARDAASVLAAPLLVKRLEELVGFVYERANAIARRVLSGLFEQRTDEPIRAEGRHEEGSRPHPWVRAPKRQLFLPVTYIGFRRISRIPPPGARQKSHAWIGPKDISRRERSQRRAAIHRRRRRGARFRRRGALRRRLWRFARDVAWRTAFRSPQRAGSTALLLSLG